MPFKLTIKNGDMKWLSDKWVEEDLVTEYHNDDAINRALAEFLYAVEDGERVTLKYSPAKTKKGSKNKKNGV